MLSKTKKFPKSCIELMNFNKTLAMKLMMVVKISAAAQIIYYVRS